MTSPTLREALEAEAREVLAKTMRSSRASIDVLSANVFDKGQISNVRSDTAIAAMLAFSTSSHEAGRRAGLEEALAIVRAGGAEWHEKMQSSRQSKSFKACRDYESMLIASGHIATAIRNLAGDERIGDG